MDLIGHARVSAALLTRDYDNIPVGVAEPNLPMPGVRVDMRLLDYLGTQPTDPPDGGIEVVHLEPQQDSMPTWRRVRIDEIQVMLFVPCMELKDQVTVTERPFCRYPDAHAPGVRWFPAIAGTNGCWPLRHARQSEAETEPLHFAAPSPSSLSPSRWILLRIG